VEQTCLALRAFVPVCINTPWYHFKPPVQPPAGTVEAAAAVPVPIMPGIVADCSSFELVGPGVTAHAIVARNNITLAQFVGWNTALDRTNPQPWAGYWVCVRA
jgi:hypothetical protein